MELASNESGGVRGKRTTTTATRRRTVQQLRLLVQVQLLLLEPDPQFWLPRFRLSLFSWPSDLPFPSQVALAVSLEFLSLELLLVKWGVLMQWLHPRGKSAGYGFMKESSKEVDKKGDDAADAAEKGTAIP